MHAAADKRPSYEAEHCWWQCMLASCLMRLLPLHSSRSASPSGRTPPRRPQRCRGRQDCSVKLRLCCSPYDGIYQLLLMPCGPDPKATFLLGMRQLGGGGVLGAGWDLPTTIRCELPRSTHQVHHARLREPGRVQHEQRCLCRELRQRREAPAPGALGAADYVHGRGEPSSRVFSRAGARTLLPPGAAAAAPPPFGLKC